ncbi:MAG: preprotein translocase subunit SecE [Lachnospiraceae bacterium]|nr:preprotein translocase subunit SecE [Lachnospiraceae bacterium]
MNDSEVKETGAKSSGAKKTQKAVEKKSGRMAGFKKEFKKIVWPDKVTAGKETAEVIVVSVILGLVIAGIDLLIKLGLDQIL